MKQVVTTVEVDHEGLEALLNQEVCVFCLNYIYAGKLIGVNDKFIKLKDASIVYETGPFSTKGYKDAQRLPTEFWYVQTSVIESYGLGK
jgi:hypothetical protein